MSEELGVFPGNEILNWDVSKMDLSARAYNSLWRSGNMTVGDVYKLNPRALYAVKNLGGLSLDEVIATMRNLGFEEWADTMDKYRPKRTQRRCKA